MNPQSTSDDLGDKPVQFSSDPQSSIQTSIGHHSFRAASTQVPTVPVSDFHPFVFPSYSDHAAPSVNKVCPSCSTAMAFWLPGLRPTRQDTPRLNRYNGAFPVGLTYTAEPSTPSVQRVLADTVSPSSTPVPVVEYSPANHVFPTSLIVSQL